jgi:RNA processing factor Prp31
VCGAAGLADELNGQVIDAINTGRIPPAFQEDLQARANELVNTVNCPPPTTDEAPDSDEKSKEKKPKKREKKGDEQQAPPEVETEPLPTITEGEE